jgi:predicted transcriptional regulator
MFYARKLTDEDVILVFTSKQEWLSRRQIAERVWRKVTPDFRARLERLVRENMLQKTIEKLPNGREMFWYRRIIG